MKNIDTIDKSNVYSHPEAFCVMKYQGLSLSNGDIVTEFLWNSRDGVTPFCLTAKDGKTELRHVDWHSDFFNPQHVPKVGDRIFVDFVGTFVEDSCIAYVRSNWNQISEEFPEMDELQIVGLFMKLHNDKSENSELKPFVFTVTQEWLDENYPSAKTEVSIEQQCAEELHSFFSVVSVQHYHSGNETQEIVKRRIEAIRSIVHKYFGANSGA